MSGFRSFSDSGWNQCPKQSEGFEIDPDEPHAGFLERHDVAIDQIAVGDYEENATDELAIGVDALPLSC